MARWVDLDMEHLHVTAVSAGCRKALDQHGLALRFSHKHAEKSPNYFVRATILTMRQFAFQMGHFLVRQPKLLKAQLLMRASVKLESLLKMASGSNFLH